MDYDIRLLRVCNDVLHTLMASAVSLATTNLFIKERKS